MLRLFIGNIPHSASELEIRNWFKEKGFEPSFVQVIRDRTTGHSRGFGFVEIQTTADMNSVVEQLSGQRMSGRVLTVNPATPRANFAGARER